MIITENLKVVVWTARWLAAEKLDWVFSAVDVERTSASVTLRIYGMDRRSDEFVFRDVVLPLDTFDREIDSIH